tara:strand:+ start:1044 stop:1325 length:282 start_codon:yes stop_codon:yes gene_type:complete
MALQKELVADQTIVGMAAPEAYLKIAGLSIVENFVSIRIHGYGSAAARNSSAEPLYIQEYVSEVPLIVGTGNLIEICYQHLKTLDDFASATDA